MEVPKNPINPEYSLAFDDVLLEPGYSEVLPTELSLHHKLGPLPLKIPIISAAMDTVTESRTAIAIALMGGMGVLHKNNSPGDQAEFVKRVKKFQHAVIQEPVTVRADQSISSVFETMDETGVTGFPVVDAEGVLVGMCTGRDLRYRTDKCKLVSDVMSSPVHHLPQGATRDDSEAFFRKFKVEKLPLVDSEGRLKGLITSKDWRQASDHPNALRDEKGQLVVGAAVGVGGSDGLERAQELIRAGVDLITVDSAHGNSRGVVEMLRLLKKEKDDLILVGGNVGTADGALRLAKEGADIVKVGMGPGSICTTRIVSGAGMPQLSAVLNVTRAIKKEMPNIGVIADGGIRYSGDITKALAAGADAVMLGSLLAGTEESPGETILYMGRSYKSYRGMGSLAAMKKGSKDRYFQEKVDKESKLVPEGVEARVPYRGSLEQVIHQLLGGLRSGMGYVGAENIEQLHLKARFNRISVGALKESHVHDVTITAEAPNYSGGSQG